ncbi:EthD domain-containing protein [Trichoderma novae-zelandiae]
MATKERLLRLTLMQYKNPNLTDDQFQKHWTEHHAPLASSWLARNGIIGYTQYHTPPSTRNLAATLAQTVGAVVAPFDAYIEFMVRSVEDLWRATADPEYPVKMQPDEEYMFEQGTMQVTVGWVEAYVQDGKVVNVVDGKSAFAQ